MKALWFAAGFLSAFVVHLGVALLMVRESRPPERVSVPKAFYWQDVLR